MPEHIRHWEVESAKPSDEETRARDIDNLVALNRASGLPADLPTITAQIRREEGEVRNRLAADVLRKIQSGCVSQEPAASTTAPGESSAPEPKEKRELSPEEAEKTLQSLLTRSKQEEYKNLCPTIDWARAERALRATPEALWTAYKAREHDPIIYFADERGFKFGSNLCTESPQSTRNCVGHKEAEEWLKRNCPNEQFNKNAEKQAEDMGWNLMTIEEGEYFAKNTPPFYEQGWRYYKTPAHIKTIGCPEGPGNAFYGYRDGNALYVFQGNANDPYGGRGWGGSLRVNYVN